MGQARNTIYLAQKGWDSVGCEAVRAGLKTRNYVG